MEKADKKDLNRPVTYGEFTEFAGFVSENVAMKSDVDKRFDSIEGNLANFKSEILTAVDKVLKEVTTKREEDAAHTINHRDITDDIQDLKKRTTRMEAHAGIR